VPILLTMASPAAQAQAQALNAKLEGQARIAIDEIEKLYLRKIARSSHVCSIACHDKAGTSGPAEALEACLHSCQMPSQQANALVQSVSVGASWGPSVLESAGSGTALALVHAWYSPRGRKSPSHDLFSVRYFRR
jgi:hypothetical protein